MIPLMDRSPIGIDAVAAAFTSLGAPVSTGRFGADMQVTFTNDGPVTISLEI